MNQFIITNHNATLAVREAANGQNHHLWNNNGTWWVHFTLHYPDYTAKRWRISLATRDLEAARIARDNLFAALRRGAPGETVATGGK